MIIQNFLLAFLFSFLGSIPPGTINLTALQVGLERKTNLAWRFALAAALIEYPYAWLAITFQKFITESPSILNNFKLISAIVMIVLGVLNLWSTQRPSGFTQKFQESGFRRGIILGILNPLTIPFWIGVTAYLSVQGWVEMPDARHLHSFLVGVSLGAFSLLIIVAYLARKMVLLFQPDSKIKLIPGFVLVGLGIYAFVEYLL